jgi:hypothetical protein
MSTGKLFALAVAGTMLAGPIAATAATPSTSAPTKASASATSASCKTLHGQALKTCEAKLKANSDKARKS